MAITRYGLQFPNGNTQLDVERYMIKQGGQWKGKQGQTIGEGLFFHYKRFMSLLWPNDLLWHRWNEAQLKEYLANRALGVIGPASSGKTCSAAVEMLADYYLYPECTTILICSTTRDRLEDRIWGEIKKYHKLAKKLWPELPGNLIEGKQRIVSDNRAESIDGRDFRNGVIGVACQTSTGYVGLGCFVAGTMVETNKGMRPIESVKPLDIVMTAGGFSHVKEVSCVSAKSLVRVSLSNGNKLDCTPEHPFLTSEGWVNASCLITGTMLMSPYETMRILRKGNEESRKDCLLLPELPGFKPDEGVQVVRKILSAEGFKERMLFKVLHDEVEDEQPGICEAAGGEQGQRGDGQKTECCHNGKSRGTTPPVGEGQVKEGVGGQCPVEKVMGETSRLWSVGLRQLWREWASSNKGGNGADGPVPRGSIQSSHPDRHGSEELLVQDGSTALSEAGLGVAQFEAGSGGGWGLPSETFSFRTGQEEGRSADIIRVDSVEVLERTDTESNEHGEGGHRVYNLEVIGHPSYVVGGVVVHNSFIGIKNKRVRLAADELQLLPSIFVFSVSNLDKNEDFKVMGLGNPKDTTDALGTLCEPATELGGWEGGVDQTPETKVWKTRFGGVCLQLVGTDSPNLDGKLGIPLITQEAIDRDVDRYGKDSLQFTMMNQGMMPKGQGSRRVITRQLCIKNRAMEQPEWLNSDRVKIAFLDAAYRGVGGDRCMYGELEFGQEAATLEEFVPEWNVASKDVPKSKHRQILALTQMRLVPVSVKLDIEPEEQIVSFVKTACGTSGIPPERFYFDAGMRTSLVTAFGRLWSPAVNSIDFGGMPSERMVSADIQIPCNKYYSKFVTELWFNVRLVIENQQFRGMTEGVMQEGCAREWTMVGANKIEVEPKIKMKEKTGKSPDLFDALACGVFGATRHGFVIANLRDPEEKKRVSDRWKLDLMKKASASWHEGALAYDA